MTINSMISTVPNLQYSVGQVQSNSSDSQEETIASILSNYDPQNLSVEDAKEIASSFKENDIEPSKELAQTMETYGFDAQEVGTLAGVVAPRPNTPPPPSQAEQDEVTDILSELLATDNEEEDSSTNAFEQILDYTSHIVSLNDNSKEKVMDILEQYSPENTELSKDDASSVIKNSLSQIFSDSNNYNSVSFYA